MDSSLMPNHLLNFQEAPSARPELQRESDRLKLLLDITNTLVSNLECRDLLRTVSASIRQVMRCDIVGVWLPDAQQIRLRQLAMDFPESKGFVKEDWQLPVEGTELGRVFKTGEPHVVRTRAGFVSDWSTPMAQAEALESGCALPLISRGRTLGVLTLGSRVENSVSPEDVEFLIRGEMDFEGIVGQSSALRHVLNLVETVAPSDSTVLLLGETGTGKELIARAIHERSRRKHRTFVKLNCAAIPTGLLESELFGHERGAFTGAIAQKTGRLELADQGSLFLDEVGDIPIEIQPKLLRALQEREFERLGSNRTKKVDIRLVAATNRDLETMMENREFRSDLYYRLNVFPIRIPPLRERPEDIPLLVRYFTQKHGRLMNKEIESIPAAAMRKLSSWHWPGNIRELEHFIERSVILTHGTALQVPIGELNNNGRNDPVAGTREANQRDEIVRVLKITDGRVAGADGAAARMDIKRTTLISRMKKLGIDPRKVS